MNKKNAESARTDKAQPAGQSMKWSAVYPRLLVARGIFGFLGLIFGIAVLFSCASLENKAALSILLPSVLSGICAATALITAAKLRRRGGITSNLTLLVMDTVFVGTTAGFLASTWNGAGAFTQLAAFFKIIREQGYGTIEWQGAPIFSWLAALIASAVFVFAIAIPIAIYYNKRKKHFNAITADPDRSALNSRLLRRPIQRCFPLFILPTLLAFIIGFAWPFLLGIYRSLSSFSSPVDFSWTGFSNYVKAFEDDGFRHAFAFTSGYTVVSIILINVLAFVLAYALTQKLKGSNIFRTVFFMPNLIGGIVLAYIWKLIFDAILGAAYLTDANIGFWALVVLVAWQQIGYIMIIYIAGLQAVSEDMLEAAKIDGAGRWQTLWRVTIPNVMPSITICVFLTLTNSFKLFDQNFALTGGSPKIPGTRILETEMLALHIYNTNSINNKWIGTAQAEAVIFFLLVAVLALIQLRATRRKEVQQ